MYTCFKPMDTSTGGLFASLAISAVGTGFFIYGKKQGRLPQLVAGLLLGVYPYFVSGLGWMLGMAAAILAGMAVAIRWGG